MVGQRRRRRPRMACTVSGWPATAASSVKRGPLSGSVASGSQVAPLSTLTSSATGVKRTVDVPSR